MQILTAIIEILVGGITGIAQGIGQGLSTLVTDIFVTGAGTTESPYALSVFGTVIVVFAGIALAIGLCRLVVKWISTLGGSRM